MKSTSNSNKISTKKTFELIEKRKAILWFILRNFNWGFSKTIATWLSVDNKTISRNLNELVQYKILIKNHTSWGIAYGIAPKYYNYLIGMFYPDTQNIQYKPDTSPKAIMRSLLIGYLHNYPNHHYGNNDTIEEHENYELYNANKYFHIRGRNFLITEMDPGIAGANFYNLYFRETGEYGSLGLYRFYILDMKSSVSYMLKQIEKIYNYMQKVRSHRYRIDIVTHSEFRKNYLLEKIKDKIIKNSESSSSLHIYGYNNYYLLDIYGINLNIPEMDRFQDLYNIRK